MGSPCLSCWGILLPGLKVTLKAKTADVVLMALLEETGAHALGGQH